MEGKNPDDKCTSNKIQKIDNHSEARIIEDFIAHLLGSKW